MWQSFQHYCIHQVMFLLHLIIRRQKSNCLINGAWIIPCLYVCQFFVTAFYFYMKCMIQYLLTGSQSWRHHVYPEHSALLGYSGPKKYVDKYWNVLIIFMNCLGGRVGGVAWGMNLRLFLFTLTWRQHFWL